jgi:hypothetical protein
LIAAKRPYQRPACSFDIVAALARLQGAKGKRLRCPLVDMSDDAVALVDAKILSLEEAILKCEVQLQKAKRQCDALPAAAVTAHHDKHPQVGASLTLLRIMRPRTLTLTLGFRFKCSSCSASGGKRSFSSKKRGSCATKNCSF